MITALVHGKLVKVGELKKSKNGKDFVNFTLAIKAEPDFYVTGICFGDNAAKVSGSDKNAVVSAKGALTESKWTDATGNERWNMAINASEIILL